MSVVEITPPSKISGTLRPPADKSISHRAILLAALAQGPTHVHSILEADDCLRTMSAVRALGVRIDPPDPEPCSLDRVWMIQGCGGSLTAPQGPVDCGNSGTTARLLMGILAGYPFETTLTGDPSLSSRPMGRVVQPLREMGAQVTYQGPSETLPLKIRGSKSLRAIDHILSVPSAQVKSAIILAGLRASGITRITEPIVTRDHTERMLESFGVHLARHGTIITIQSASLVSPGTLLVPGDISSAAFFWVLSACHPDAKLITQRVGLNQSRTGILDVLTQMGVGVRPSERAVRPQEEPWGDITVESTRVLKPCHVSHDQMGRLVDELPILMVAATQAVGTSVFEDVRELRVKESDRVSVLTEGLRRMGAQIRVQGDHVEIQGPTPLRGTDLDSAGDHRMAMCFAVASCLAAGSSRVSGFECVAISYPSFLKDLRGIFERGGKAEIT